MVLSFWFTVVPILLLLVRDGMLAGLTRDYAQSGHEERRIIMTSLRDSMIPVEENIAPYVSMPAYRGFAIIV